MYDAAFPLLPHTPRIAPSEPIVRFFYLIAVNELLFEKTVLITDSVSVQRNGQPGSRIEKTRGKPSEAAVAKRSIFDLLKNIHVHALFCEYLFYLLRYAQFHQIVIKHSAH